MMLIKITDDAHFQVMECNGMLSVYLRVKDEILPVSTPNLISMIDELLEAIGDR